MRQHYHSILKWSLLTGTSTIILKLCYESVLLHSSRPMSNYGTHLASWALTGTKHPSIERNSREQKIREDLQCIGAQIYFRHGARTPLFLLPGLDEVEYSKEHIESLPTTKWDIKLITKLKDQVVAKEQISSANDVIGNQRRQLKAVGGGKVVTGQLTSVGETQLYQLGKLIRSEIVDNGLIPATYDPKIVYCRSTYMDRTIASARSFLSGLFASSDQQIQAKGPFEIEVHHFPDEDMFPNSRAYPVLQKCKSALDLYSSLADDHQLKKARQALLARLGVKEYEHGILELHDDIVSRQAHNFTVPQEYLELTKDFDSLSAREFVSMATSIGYDEFVRATCGSLLYLMKKNFDSILKNFLEEKENQSPKAYQKLFVYSGHDTTLVPLAMGLEIFDMRWPKYGSHLFLKYYISKTNPEETFVKVHYLGEPQLLPNCDNHYCPYSTFIQNLANRFREPN